MREDEKLTNYRIEFRKKINELKNDRKKVADALRIEINSLLNKGDLNRIDEVNNFYPGKSFGMLKSNSIENLMFVLKELIRMRNIPEKTIEKIKVLGTSLKQLKVKDLEIKYDFKEKKVWD